MRCLLIMCVPFITLAQPNIKQVELEFIQLLNDYRKSEGAGVVHVSTDATLTANIQNTYLTLLNTDSNIIKLTHVHPNYALSSDRLFKVNSNMEYWKCTENLLYLGVSESTFNSYTDLELAFAFFNIWKKSTSHNLAMLNSTYNYAGLSFAYNKVTHSAPTRFKYAFDKVGNLIVVQATDKPTYSFNVFATLILIDYDN